MKMIISSSKALNLFRNEFLSQIRKMILLEKTKALMKKKMKGNLKRTTWISILRTSDSEMKRRMKREEIRVIDKICFMKSKEFQRLIDTRRLKWTTMKLRFNKTMTMIQKTKDLNGC